MKTSMRSVLLSVSFLSLLVLSGAMHAGAAIANDEKLLIEKEKAVVIVDKKKNEIHVAEYNDGRYKPVITYNTTMGQVLGDKMIEGDLKTPEGIYDFSFQVLPPALKPKFGVMALYITYPNPFDKASRKTGFDILLHGTDDPSRLTKKYDSKGCVVVDNSYLENIWKYVTLKQTKVIITKDFDKLNNTERLPRLKNFVNEWVNAWSSKDLDTYINSYAYEFRNDGKSLIQYKRYKDALNQKYDTITVTADNVRYFMHEKYDVVTFDQTYESTINGKTAFKLKGKKTLYLQERNGQYRIIREDMDRS